MGILDAGAAVRLAAGGHTSAPGTRPTVPLRALAGVNRIVRPGVRGRLWGGAQVRAPDRIVAWQWQQLAGPAVRLSDPRQPRPLFTAPRSPAQLLFRLTIRDSSGQPASAVTRVTVTSAGH